MAYLYEDEKDFPVVKPERRTGDGGGGGRGGAKPGRCEGAVWRRSAVGGGGKWGGDRKGVHLGSGGVVARGAAAEMNSSPTLVAERFLNDEQSEF